MVKRGFLFVMLILCTFSVLGVNDDYHLKLLAVHELNGTYVGSDADLYLELKEGTGRVFLDTYPLTKMDTQVSTRFAKDIACKHFKLNCNNYDFIYTIKSAANIIGGPSAGAAIAALTTIAVLDLDYNQKISITGTINSGGIIGQVGGVKEKLEAAKEIGLKEVMIPKATTDYELLDLNQTEDSTLDPFIQNQTHLNLIEYAQKNLSLDVLEVMDLDEVIFQLTGKNLNHENITIKQNINYQEIMLALKKSLCERTETIEMDLKKAGIVLSSNLSHEVKIKKERAENSTLIKDYYSAASFCFGNNIILKDQYYQKQNLSNQTYQKLFAHLNDQVHLFEKDIEDEKINTISDLQTLMIVKERLNDVKEQIQSFADLKEEDYSYLLAYAEERFYSASSWKQFFLMDGKKLLLNDEQLKNSCLQKKSEAEERYQYVNVFLENLIVYNIKDKIDSATASLNNQDYELCLMKAIQAKAEADAILSVLGLPENSFPEFIESKSKAVERVISENDVEGMFPILGYSYYQYANSLKDQEPQTALIYLEYALEMSDLGIYFPEPQTQINYDSSDHLEEKWAYLILGFSLGLFVMFMFRKK